MLEAVVLGVVGVLIPPGRVFEARIERAAARLSALGWPGAVFRETALRRLRDGETRCLLSRVARELGWALPASIERELVRDPGSSLPRPAAAGWPDTDSLRRIRSHCRLAFLDDGDRAPLESWLRHLQIDVLADCRLWTGELGRQARSPSPYAFRWLAERLAISPRQGLYVAGTRSLRHGAAAAGWSVWPDAIRTDLGTTVDLNAVADWLEAGGAPPELHA